MRRRARSVPGSRPTSVASARAPSGSVTLMPSTRFTVALVVTTRPSRHAPRSTAAWVERERRLARIRAQDVRYYADPRRAKPGEINCLHGGRGVYFDDPNGHLMEIITHPYGDPPEQI